MKKAFSVLAALVLVAPLAFASFSLKLGGGFTTVQGDDYNKGMMGFVDFSRAYSTNNLGSYDGDLNGLASMGMSFSGEAIYNFTPNLGVGLGAGYFETMAKRDSFYNDGMAFFLWWVQRDFSNKARVSVIPITLSFHYTLPISPAISFNVFAGPGLYLTNFQYEDEADVEAYFLGVFLTDDYVASTDFKANKTAFGFQGGLGFEFNVTPSLSFFVNGLFRYLTVSDIKGDWEFTVEDFLAGTTTTLSENDFYLWYFEFAYGGTDYPHLGLDDVAPSGANVSNVGHAKINLTGFSALVGFKFRFGGI